MKDPKDQSTLDAFPVKKKGRRGPPKTTTEEEKREQSRQRQIRYIQRKKDKEKATSFALGLIKLVEVRKNRSSKSTLLDFVQYLGGFKENLECNVEYENGFSENIDFEKLKKLVCDDAEIIKVN